MGLQHSDQVEWVHLIYPTMLGRNVSAPLYPRLYRARLYPPHRLLSDVLRAARPLLCWREHHALEELRHASLLPRGTKWHAIPNGPV